MLLHAHQRYEFAEPFYLRAHRLDPGSFSWACYLGIIQGRLGKPAEESSSLRLATKLNPVWTQGKYEEAVAHLHKALDGQDGGDPLRVYTLALAYAQLGKLEEAERYAFRAMRKANSPGQAGLARDIESLLTELRRAASSHGD